MCVFMKEVRGNAVTTFVAPARQVLILKEGRGWVCGCVGGGGGGGGAPCGLGEIKAK